MWTDTTENITFPRTTYVVGNRSTQIQDSETLNILETLLLPQVLFLFSCRKNSQMIYFSIGEMNKAWI